MQLKKKISKQIKKTIDLLNIYDLYHQNVDITSTNDRQNVIEVLSKYRKQFDKSRKKDQLKGKINYKSTNKRPKNELTKNNELKKSKKLDPSNENQQEIDQDNVKSFEELSNVTPAQMFYSQSLNQQPPLNTPPTYHFQQHYQMTSLPPQRYAPPPHPQPVYHTYPTYNNTPNNFPFSPVPSSHSSQNEANEEHQTSQRSLEEESSSSEEENSNEENDYDTLVKTAKDIRSKGALTKAYISEIQCVKAIKSHKMCGYNGYKLLLRHKKSTKTLLIASLRQLARIDVDTFLNLCKLGGIVPPYGAILKVEDQFLGKSNE
ncbi:hypothetical protein BN7_2431 [Wickerhamomyces ciferrii]|uniref:Uncharacterized protein n=1 Tax=Wickerhamomyces ciferrii (strain ATCC 14091 / BCRC 22168 / CBS 111 / JCM 3599 / NBRC 0793 / NRRL Y-1031 F-60-10) TaxID=1206466 RepID=K0KIS3_WICCF|nr:uncharacterized protein BN7_2431 [Wickerhamomyces ciferrii]CCH42886.1 hypothetical protein BN7_2431 [Wickerhamomyces ciferrii]